MTEPTGGAPFVFAVIADSHFHPESPLTQSAYRSDRNHNDRNRAVVEMLERARPDLVIHLGDVPHPVPGLAAHAEALSVAQAAYAGLSAPLHVVPGNHDVGDKPHPWAPAPPASALGHQVFSEHWGPAYRSIDHKGCRFLLLDTPVMNSGGPLEAEQWAWLERQLATRGDRRIFAFTHYPPFLCDPDEEEHYDNLAEPARTQLLRLLSLAGTEALFAGHVHHFFYSRYGPTDLYIAPATSFVRPGYAELAAVPPADAEFGRDAVGRLGFFLVHVQPSGYRLESVRTEGAGAARALAPPLIPGPAPQPPLPLGVTLRHAWDQVIALPADNLDPFRRKRARNDLALQASWDLGVTTLRVPLEDVLRDRSRARLEALHTRGQRALPFAVGAPSPETWALLRRHAGLIEAVELILPRPLDPAALAAALGSGLPIWLSVVGRPGSGASEGVYFSHFPAPGFTPGDPELADLPAVDGVVFRIDGATDPWDGVAAAVAAAPRAIAQIWLPRGGEGAIVDDDLAVARQLARSFAAAVAHPAARVVLDTFTDHDRGYYPRHGLVDRRGDPRPGFHVLRNLGRLFPGDCAVEPRGEGFWIQSPARAGLLLPGGGEGPGIDLITGAPAQRSPGPFVILSLR